jgi:hypothetical protein
MKRLYVKPGKDRTLRDPDRDYEVVPPDGKHVPRNIYWLRRIAQGDAVEAKAPPPAKPAKPATSKKED